MNTYDMNGQVAVVTGGAQGIGYAVAERLRQSGATVFLWDMDAALVSDAAARLGATGIALDVTDRAAVVEAARKVCEDGGRLDALVTSAGLAGPNAPLHEYPVSDWQRIMAVNVDGTLNCCQAVLPHMRARNYGRIVTIASVAGKEGNPGASAYSASKAAVIGMTKSMGKENADLDIAINTVTPAAARTRIFEQMSQEHIDFMLSKIPRGRFLELGEAASMICWLCTSENSFTTGAVFDLSGGRATY
ncbi:SDR family NAD(P)-dependent oxidoreductase [Frigidibacter sp. ROC022]|uniref:SDR family NAD(P)-dependent oxidoreductase n=1 Tax=Frigidibacter sp. ROC022 TaxID=2971796 RepID=UPI00215A0E85|nr:SDR family NAD(P)-dependent oxidoreductase [Frigidibacter sp. ROC022]MCR8724625.1 SDR family oxidoreductase [Frigidibacter sp. ROC022]